MFALLTGGVKFDKKRFGKEIGAFQPHSPAGPAMAERLTRGEAPPPAASKQHDGSRPAAARKPQKAQPKPTGGAHATVRAQAHISTQQGAVLCGMHASLRGGGCPTHTGRALR